jgi:uncharacterized protein
MTAPQPARYPRANPTPLDRPYWEGLAEGEVRVQVCGNCGARLWYPRPMCSKCYSEDLAWKPIEPRGTVYTYTVTHQRTGFAFDLSRPFVVAVVELDADTDVRMVGQLVGVDPDQVAVGLKVKGGIVRTGPDPDASLTLQFQVAG